MLTPEQINNCPSCQEKKCLASIGSIEYGVINKIDGCPVKMTRQARCTKCRALISEVWVISTRSFIPDMIL